MNFQEHIKANLPVVKISFYPAGSKIDIFTIAPDDPSKFFSDSSFFVKANCGLFCVVRNEMQGRLSKEMVAKTYMSINTRDTWMPTRTITEVSIISPDDVVYKDLPKMMEEFYSEENSKTEKKVIIE